MANGDTLIQKEIKVKAQRKSCPIWTRTGGDLCATSLHFAMYEEHKNKTKQPNPQLTKQVSMPCVVLV